MSVSCYQGRSISSLYSTDSYHSQVSVVSSGNHQTDPKPVMRGKVPRLLQESSSSRVMEDEIDE